MRERVPIMVEINQPGNRFMREKAGAGLATQGTRGTRDFSNRQIALLFIAMTVIAAIPIALHPLPPLADYVNHLSRMHVIASIGSDPDLARYYEIDWQIIPNLMMDLVVPPLNQIMSVFAAGQVYTISSFVLIL